MSKRLAESQLTPEELSRKLNKDGSSIAQGGEESKATQAVLNSRKIIKVKRHQIGDKIITEPGQGQFKLLGSLSTVNTTS